MIFTIDALFALGIFIAAAIGLYSFFGETTTFGFAAANVYGYSDNVILSHDNAEIISKIVYEYQRGNLTGANTSFQQVLDRIGYPANGYIYLLEGSQLIPILEIKNYEFDEYFVVRKYLTLTLTKGLNKNGTNVVVTAPSTLANETIQINVQVNNPNPTPISVSITLDVYNETNDSLSWTISPTSYSIVVPGSSTSEVNFDVTVPPDAVIDEYYAKSVVSGGLTETATDPFNVIRYGLIMMEVDSKQ